MHFATYCKKDFQMHDSLLSPIRSVNSSLISVSHAHIRVFQNFNISASEPLKRLFILTLILAYKWHHYRDISKNTHMLFWKQLY